MLIRILFVAVGIPLLGSLYTSALQLGTDLVSTQTCASTQLVACSFVDFQAWVKSARLAPMSGSTLVSIPSSVGGSIAGQASNESYLNLRKTTYDINKQTHALSYANIDGFNPANLKDTLEFTGYVMNTADPTINMASVNEIVGLLTKYMQGSFYSSGAFESDALSTFRANHSTSVLGRRAGLNETDPPDTKNTLYELFEQTNTAEAWNNRSSDENAGIFTNSGSYDWGLFNVYGNGGMSAGFSGSSPSGKSTVTYSGGTKSIHHNAPLCLDSEIGLGTLAMYNYLASSFDESYINTYSTSKSASTRTNKQHRSVNLVGSGIMNLLYYFSILAVMLTSTILGFCYAFGMILGNLKRSFTLITQIPVSALGVLSAIARVFTTVMMMIGEIIASVVLYQVMSGFLANFTMIMEQPIRTWISGTALGGVTAAMGLVDASSMLTQTRVALGLNLGFSALLMSVFAVFAARKAPAFQRVYAQVMELLWIKLGLYNGLQVRHPARASVPSRTRVVWDMIFASLGELLAM